MIAEDLTTVITSRLKTIKEQIEEVMKLVNNNHDAEEIIQHFKAIDKTYQNTYSLILDTAYRKALAIKIVDTLQVCPRDCDEINVIMRMHQEFPTLEFHELSGRLREISEIQQRVTEYREEVVY